MCGISNLWKKYRSNNYHLRRESKARTLFHLFHLSRFYIIKDLNIKNKMIKILVKGESRF